MGCGRCRVACTLKFRRERDVYTWGQYLPTYLPTYLFTVYMYAGYIGCLLFPEGPCETADYNRVILLH